MKKCVCVYVCVRERERERERVVLRIIIINISSISLFRDFALSLTHTHTHTHTYIRTMKSLIRKKKHQFGPTFPNCITNGLLNPLCCFPLSLHDLTLHCFYQRALFFQQQNSSSVCFFPFSNLCFTIMTFCPPAPQRMGGLEMGWWDICWLHCTWNAGKKTKNKKQNNFWLGKVEWNSFSNWNSESEARSRFTYLFTFQDCRMDIDGVNSCSFLAAGSSMAHSLSCLVYKNAMLVTQLLLVQ